MFLIQVRPMRLSQCTVTQCFFTGSDTGAGVHRKCLCRITVGTNCETRCVQHSACGSHVTLTMTHFVTLTVRHAVYSTVPVVAMSH